MRTSLLAVVSIVLLWNVASGQSEFIVHSRPDTTQRSPAIAGDGATGYVVVWVSQDEVGSGSGRDIVMRRFDAADAPLGPDAPVQVAAAGDQQKPAVAMNARGDVVVAWTSLFGGDTLFDVRARLFRHDGFTSDEIAVNTTRSFTQTNPSVAIDEAGQWVVAWESWEQDGSDRGVYGRRFDLSGAAQSGEFLIPVTTAYSQAKPVVRFLKDGRFLVLWESWSTDPASGYDVFGSVFRFNDLASTGEFQLNTTTTNYQWYADVAVLEDSSFVAVWCSWEQDGSDGSIVSQRFTPSLEKIGGELLVNASTAQYQWLPKVVPLPGGGYAVVWSSWKQDGDREGIVAQWFTAEGRRSSFEMMVNTTTASFQWEPGVIPAGPDGLVLVWSSWGQTGSDYDVVGRRIAATGSQGFLDPTGMAHAQGRSTARLQVHVIDTLALTGQTYEALLDSLGSARSALTVRNMATGDTLVDAFPIGSERTVFYLSPAFEGVAVQVIPEYEFALDFASSHFANHTGSTVQFTTAMPTGAVLAPIDAAVIWGSTDTLADGSYAAPLDSALDTSLKKFAVPFMGWDLTENTRLELVVNRGSARRWMPGQRITIRTPAIYRKSEYDRHADINSTPNAAAQLPGIGDTNYVFTRRPIRPGERYTFTTDKALLVDVQQRRDVLPERFALEQNYPNPFNPSTVIGYTVGRGGDGETGSVVRLSVYDLLGREVAVLVNERQAPGTYRVRFEASGLASGVYFYRIASGGLVQTRRMLLLR